MPYMVITSNTGLSPHRRVELLTAASQAVSEMLGKSENYVMASYLHNDDMVFAGNNEPTAYVELKSIGLPDDQTSGFSSAICKLLDHHLGVPADRVYIEFSSAERHLWGWNNKTF